MAESAPPLVLVTGASGFVSTWLIKELLEKGEYRVRGTVRDKSKEEKVLHSTCLSLIIESVLLHTGATCVGPSS